MVFPSSSDLPQPPVCWGHRYLGHVYWQSLWTESDTDTVLCHSLPSRLLVVTYHCKYQDRYEKFVLPEPCSAAIAVVSVLLSLSPASPPLPPLILPAHSCIFSMVFVLYLISPPQDTVWVLFLPRNRRLLSA